MVTLVVVEQRIEAHKLLGQFHRAEFVDDAVDFLAAAVFVGNQLDLY
jgi:hypothetical protein